MSNKQNVALMVMFMMVVSAFAFTPSASAENSLTIQVKGFHGDFLFNDARSFSSVNGTASYLVTLTNDGTEDFTDLAFRSDFCGGNECGEDDSWKDDNVTMELSSDSNINGTGLINIDSLLADASVDIFVNVTVGYGVDTSQTDVVMPLMAIDQDGNEYEAPETIVTVTNWLAYESNYPDLPAVETYNNGDQYNYTINIKNIRVDNTSVPKDNDDTIRLSLPTPGWSVRSNDLNWSNASGELVLDGMSAGQLYSFNFGINLTGNPPAGAQIVNLFAMSGGGGGGMMGGDPPYYQPDGMLSIPVIVAERFGVSVSGSSSQIVNISQGEASVSWKVIVSNLGNTQDTFAITWNQTGVPTGWVLTALPSTTGTVGRSSSNTFDVLLTVPANTVATEFDSNSQATFSMVATSSDEITSSPSQTFNVKVEQNFGLGLTVNNQTKGGIPEELVEFTFSLSNTGNGEDKFSLDVSGSSAIWSPELSSSNITVPAFSSSTFLLSIDVPANREAGDSEDFIVTATSSAGLSTNITVNLDTIQVYNIDIKNYAGSTGSATVSQATKLDLRLNITNEGNGMDFLTLSLSKDAPSWASLGSGTDSPIQVAPGATESVVVTLSPTTEDLSGRDYIFEVIAKSSNGDEWTSPQLSINIEVKQTTGEDVEVEELEPEEDSPGFSLLLSFISLTLVVLSRRKD